MVAPLSTRAAARVDQPKIAQTYQCLLIGIATLTLIAYWAIPMQAKGFQLAQNGVAGTWWTAWWIDILNTQQPLPSRMPGIEKTT